MLQGVEYIPFDSERPHAGQAALFVALNRVIDTQSRKREQRDALILVVACLALLILLRD